MLISFVRIIGYTKLKCPKVRRQYAMFYHRCKLKPFSFWRKTGLPIPTLTLPYPNPPEKSTKFKGLTDKAKIRRLQGVALKGQKTKDQKKKKKKKVCLPNNMSQQKK